MLRFPGGPTEVPGTNARANWGLRWSGASGVELMMPLVAARTVLSLWLDGLETGAIVVVHTMDWAARKHSA